MTNDEYSRVSYTFETHLLRAVHSEVPHTAIYMMESEPHSIDILMNHVTANISEAAYWA